jgi:hypothetical protein
LTRGEAGRRERDLLSCREALLQDLREVAGKRAIGRRIDVGELVDVASRQVDRQARRRGLRRGKASDERRGAAEQVGAQRRRRDLDAAPAVQDVIVPALRLVIDDREIDDSLLQQKSARAQ